MAEYSDNYNWLLTQFGPVMESHRDFGKSLREAGPIAPKTAHLIQMAGAAAVRSEGSVHSHVKRALEDGATPGEIYHTIILLASTIGFPATAAAISWAREIVEKG